MNRLLILLIIFVLTTPSLATIIEVPHDYELLQVAIDASSDGDTVLVDHGTYYGGFNFQSKRITLASHFIFTQNEADIEATVLDGGEEMIVLTITHLGVTNVAVIGLTVQNGLGVGNWPNVHSGGIDVINSSVRIEHCYIHNNVSTGDSNRGAGIYYGSPNGGVISNCKIWENTAFGGAGIAIRNYSDNVRIEYCEVFRNGLQENGDGILIGYSYNISCEHCLLYDNGNYGIYVSRSTGTVDHCTITDNRREAISFRASYEHERLLTIDNSIVKGGMGFDGVGVNSGDYDYIQASYSNLIGNSGEPWLGIGCIDENPMFRDPELTDYRLQPDSPCINAGNPDSGPSDMGAIPYQIAEFSLHPSVYMVPANGGMITYDARVTSNFSQGSDVNFWTEVVTPGGVVVGPLETDMIYVPPMSEFVLEGRTQVVPAWVPSGIYTFRAYIGRPYQVEFQLVDEFIFTKGTFPFEGTPSSGSGDWFSSDVTTASGDPFQQDSVSDLPTEFSIAPIFPNPFNSSATVKISLPESSELTVAVYNAAGQWITTLHDGTISAGSHTMNFDASQLASGLYFVHAAIPGKLNQVQKVMLVR
jgi:Right handed beta helix region/Secretion system C-terminal sorting domain